MTTYKLYIRHRGHVTHKYESATSAFEACCQALGYFRGGSVVKLVRIGG